jgi:hypothetical protein
MNVLLLKTMANETHERTITHFNTMELALINLYGSMRACVGDTNCIRAFGEIIDDDGFVHKSDRYERKTESEVGE